MALIKCRECGNEISEWALTCPKCGIPIASSRESRAAGAQLTTIQETSKKFKLQTLISVSLILIGLIGIIWSFSGGIEGETSFIPAFLSIIGFVGIVTYPSKS
jgi:uncharacterized membrane protein YvbJ